MKNEKKKKRAFGKNEKKNARLKNEKKRAFGKNEKKNARLKNEKKKRAFEKVEASCLRGEVFRTRVEKVVFSNARPVFQTRVRKNHFFERAFEKKKKKTPFFFYARPAFRTSGRANYGKKWGKKWISGTEKRSLKRLAGEARKPRFVAFPGQSRLVVGYIRKNGQNFSDLNFRKI